MSSSDDIEPDVSINIVNGARHGEYYTYLGNVKYSKCLYNNGRKCGLARDYSDNNISYKYHYIAHGNVSSIVVNLSLFLAFKQRLITIIRSRRIAKIAILMNNTPLIRDICNMILLY